MNGDLIHGKASEFLLLSLRPFLDTTYCPIHWDAEDILTTVNKRVKVTIRGDLMRNTTEGTAAKIRQYD